MPCNLVFIQQVSIALQTEEIKKSQQALNIISKQLGTLFKCDVALSISPTVTYSLTGGSLRRPITIALRDNRLIITGTKDVAPIENIFQLAAGLLQQEKIAKALESIGTVEKNYQGNDLIITLEV
jgi:hypothetical protein